jgi:hypothetical protein
MTQELPQVQMSENTVLLVNIMLQVMNYFG